MGSGILGFAAPIAVGILHQKAVEKRMQEQANERGYVTPDTPSREGRLYDIAAGLLDPTKEAERSVSISKRFNLSVWRANIRAHANTKRPGETYEFTWDMPWLDKYGDPIINILNYKGVTTSDTIKQYKGPIYIATAAKDPIAGNDPQILCNEINCANNNILQVYSDSHIHGTDMFSDSSLQPPLDKLIISWLNTAFGKS